MNERRLPSPHHQTIRTVLRIGGPILLVVGLIFMITGLVSFFSAVGSFEGPRLFWMVFLGMPILFAGLVMTKAGYLGDIYRYIATEAAPVGTDAFNEIAEGIQPGVRNLARSVTEGVAEGQTPRERKT